MFLRGEQRCQDNFSENNSKTSKLINTYFVLTWGFFFWFILTFYFEYWLDDDQMFFIESEIHIFLIIKLAMKPLLFARNSIYECVHKELK